MSEEHPTRVKPSVAGVFNGTFVCLRCGGTKRFGPLYQAVGQNGQLALSTLCPTCDSQRPQGFAPEGWQASVRRLDDVSR